MSGRRTRIVPGRCGLQESSLYALTSLCAHVHFGVHPDLVTLAKPVARAPPWLLKGVDERLDPHIHAYMDAYTKA